MFKMNKLIYFLGDNVKSFILGGNFFDGMHVVYCCWEKEKSLFMIHNSPTCKGWSFVTMSKHIYEINNNVYIYDLMLKTKLI